MLDVKRGLVLLSGALVLSGCEVIALTPDRVDEGSGATITVTEIFNDDDECVNETVEIITFDPETSERIVLGSGMAGAVGEDWSIEVPAPAERGSYPIYAACGSTETPIPEELVVQPVFAPVVDPTRYVTGSEPDSIMVTGDFCINSGPFISDDEFPLVALDEHEEEEPPGPSGLPFPTVIAALGDDEQTAVATVHQPFDETWALELAAPATPGTHMVGISCTFFDYVSGGFFEELLSGIPIDPGPIGVSAFDSHDELDLPPFLTEEVSGSLVAVQVDGILELDSAEVDEGDSVTATNADSSPCAGTVTVQLLDGETVVDSTDPAVAEDGTWSATFDDLAAGAYTVAAECVGDEEAGNFSYQPAVLSVAGVQPTTTTTTTTTVPSGNVASDSATPVRAQPAFTG